ncbi:uncharacterized protein LOC100679480 isoform X1 [Nasonia vitripennis]|uniref:Uncharacterized protein n=1 Tax=Nasonia vitripennis TaxID=7425 RepID=A0A7M7GFY3_NASVI|nr:uncharacterized protein LOC100679480 isoform X1 [Nasonia vitripennis]
MALNKSNKSTPSSRSGYLRELTASAGKTSNFLLPVRIKVTPQHNSTIAPLSGGKKNHTKMMQPVLIKDLLQSTQKSKSTTLASVSTQKKRARAQRSIQPYLNTQSCYKPKGNEDAESSFLGRKSYGGNKVRRQLYQTLDSPQRSALDGKENTAKNVKPRVKSTRDSEVPAAKSFQMLNKSRKSLLLPPNSIRNSIIRKSGNFKPPGKQGVKSNASVVNKSTKDVSRVTEAKLVKNNLKKNVQKVEDDIDMETDFSSPDADVHGREESRVTREIYTMTSPMRREAASSKSLFNLNKLERPLVIVKSATKKTNNGEAPCLEMQNLNINPTQSYSHCPEFDFSQINCSDTDGIMQCKAYLEQSIQACEDQAFKLKQVLNFVNALFVKAKTMPTKETVNIQTDEQIRTDDKFDISSNTMVNSQNSSDVTDIIDKSLENKEITDDVNSLSTAKPEIKVYVDEENNDIETTEKLPIPIKILVTQADLNQEAKDTSSDTLSEMARLSTIGEVSCEGDESNKDESRKEEKNEKESENKENIEDSSPMLLTPTVSPKTPKTPRRRSVMPGSGERRRSARLAAKRRSLSVVSDTESDKQDSFTLLENELNVVHEVKVSSKSLPASPMKAPMTPGCIKQWDKRVERPLREYMALKMNGTFLVTPDVKRFQSCLEPTDTPHSRKSLSRKIFMELCDLYAESPEPK